MIISKNDINFLLASLSCGINIQDFSMSHENKENGETEYTPVTGDRDHKHTVRPLYSQSTMITW